MKAICIKCWNPDALVKLHCDGSGMFECAECGEEFDRDAVHSALAAMRKGWAKLIKWADAYPVEEPEEVTA